MAAIERRALRMTELATSNSEDSLDLIQDAMLAFVRKYRHRPEEEWTPLFHRVLQNRIRDWYRQNKVRNRWRIWLSHKPEEEASDPIQEIADPCQRDPAQQVLYGNFPENLEKALMALPLRQQQAFLLRVWEGLDVASTAKELEPTASNEAPNDNE